MKEDKVEKKRKIMVYFMAFIMVSSVFGVIFFGFSGVGTTKLKYNDFKFVRSGDVWVTKLNGVDAIFTYFPIDVEFIEVEQSIINLLRNKLEIDVTANINDTFIQSIALSHFQMKATLGNFNIFVRDGFTTENEFNLPIIRCEDATSLVPVIYFKEGNSTRVYSNESCIIVEANNHVDFIKVKDRIVYSILDIIK